MQVHIEKLSPTLVEVQIELPAERVTSEVEKSFKSLSRTARVRGFRRGKAPRKVLAHLYGRAVHAEVAERLINESLDKALSAESMQPLTRPAVEPAELTARQPFAFKARFEVRPEIDEVKWQGLSAVRPSTTVTDEQIAGEIETLRRQHATMQPVEGRAVASGDMASIVVGFDVNGEQREERAEVEVGAGQIFAELDQALVGMKMAESKDVQATLPDDKGESKLFHLSLEELKERILPAIDDEFAKDCDQDDLEALRASISARLAEQHRERAEEDVARQLVAQLCEKNDVPVPPSLVTQQARMSEREMRAIAEMTGRKLDDPGVAERVRADAEQKVRAGLLMAEIAKANKVKVGEQDIEQGYADLAAQSGKNVAKIKAEYREKSKRDLLIGMILEDKVLALMEQAANISDAE